MRTILKISAGYFDRIFPHLQLFGCKTLRFNKSKTLHYQFLRDKMFSKLKLLLVIISLSIHLFFAGCVDIPDDIIFPKWDVDMNLPLVNRSFTMDDVLKTKDYVYKVPGSSNDTVYLFQSKVVEQSTDIREFLRLDEVIQLEGLILPASQFDSTLIYILFPDGAEIDSAAFFDGIFSYSFFNPSGQIIQLQIGFPDFYSAEGLPVNIEIILNPFQGVQGEYSFLNHTYRISPLHPPDKKNSFRFVVKAVSSVPVTFNADIYTGPFEIEYVYGRLNPKTLSERGKSHPFYLSDYRQYGGKTVIKSARMNLKAEYISAISYGLDVILKNVKIIGVRNEGDTFPLLDSTGSPTFNMRLINGTAHQIFTKNNSNINELISFLPDTLLILSEYVLNPDNKSLAISYLDSVKYLTDISALSYLAIRESVVGDTSFLNIEMSDREDISSGQEAEVIIESENAIPLDCWARITIVDENYQPLFTLRDESNGADSLLFIAADVDANGEVIKPTINPVRLLNLTGNELELLSRAHYVISSFTIRTTRAQLEPPIIVTMSTASTFKMRVYCTLKFRVNNDG